MLMELRPIRGSLGIFCDDRDADMRVGIAGPISTEALRGYLTDFEGMPPGLGGSPVTSLVTGLLRRGIDVSVFTLDKSVREDVVYRGRNLTVYVGRYRPRARDRALTFFREERAAIRRFVAADQPDVVHAHWTYEFALGALSVRPDTVVTLHDWSPTILSLNRDAYRFVRLLMDRFCIRKARTLTCVSPYIAELLRDGRRSAVVVPNIAPPVADRDCRELKPGHATILCVTEGFGKLKNVATLLEAYSRLHAERPGVTLRLVGGGMGSGGPCHSWAAERRLDFGVEFMGRRAHDEVLDLMRCSDLLVHPSLEESFGMVLVEAMSSGTPVIGGVHSGAVPWVLDNGAAGVLVDVRSASSLADAMRRTLDDTAAWLCYSLAGRERVSSCFGEASVVDGYLAVYTEVIER